LDVGATGLARSRRGMLAPELGNEMVAVGLHFGHGDSRVHTVDNANEGKDGQVLCAGNLLSGN
jgi:hypothetical protein